MKRLFFLLFTLFIIYFGLQLSFYELSKGETERYHVFFDDKRFEITEISNFVNSRSYLYNIEYDNLNFNFQIFYNFGKKTKVLKDIIYYEDEQYRCLLPIFKDKKILTDMLCYNGKEFYNYHDIMGKNKNLDSFIKKIEYYDLNKFIDNEESAVIEGLNVYKNNLVQDHYLSLTNYKGIYVLSDNINSTVYDISLFDKDVYNQKLGIYYKNYYVVPDYNNKSTFNFLNVINLVNLDMFKIQADDDISFDSIIKIEDNNLYLFDKDSNINYEIDLKGKKLIKSKIPLNTTTFELEKLDEQIINNNRIEYLFKKDNENYKVYKKINNNLIYLFDTNTIENVIYVEDYIYFIDRDTLKVYNDKFGVKKIIQNKELEFNKNIKFYVYK